MVTSKQAVLYYKNKNKVRRIILTNVRRKGHIIYGARAVNQQVRKHLQKETEDYDVFSKTPKKTAHRVEKKLDKSYGYNAFEVEPAKHTGTYKLKNRITKRGVADYTKPKGRIKIIRRKKIKYAHTSHQLKQIKKSLADPKSKFRHDKDKETRQRINLNKKFKAKRRRKRTHPLMRRGFINF